MRGVGAAGRSTHEAYRSEAKTEVWEEKMKQGPYSCGNLATTFLLTTPRSQNSAFEPDLPGSYEGIFVKGGGQTYVI